MEYFLELGNAFRTCFLEKYTNSYEKLIELESMLSSQSGEDVNFEDNGVKITHLTYEATSVNSADVSFDAMVDMGRFWLLIPMVNSFSIETDAETGDKSLAIGEVSSSLEWIDTSYLDNLTLSDVGLSS